MNLYGSKPLGKEHGTFTFIKEVLKKQCNRQTDGRNFILTKMYTWHMGSRWCT
jgi:hypothetical protein